MAPTPNISDVLAGVGGRRERLHRDRGVTLTELAPATGVSKSTLSRLESGQRKHAGALAAPPRKSNPRCPRPRRAVADRSCWG
jgi:DNA-binding XRE family transcriptional regulator